MYDTASSFNQPLNNWDVGNVTNMAGMFYSHSSNNVFNGDISTWDTGKVTNMGTMFHKARYFNQDVSTWDTRKVGNMNAMFKLAQAFNQDIRKWDIEAIKKAVDFDPNRTDVSLNNMFMNATAMLSNYGATATPSISWFETYSSADISYQFNDISLSDITDASRVSLTSDVEALYVSQVGSEPSVSALLSDNSSGNLVVSVNVRFVADINNAYIVHRMTNYTDEAKPLVEGKVQEHSGISSAVLNSSHTPTINVSQEDLGNTTFATFIANICFPGNTPVLTDQGEVAIEKLDLTKHTIRKRSIVAVTKVKYTDKHLICIEKDSFGKNIPCRRTVTTGDHEIFYKGMMVAAKKFVNLVDGVRKVKYTGDILYNVLLKTHDKMMVNNMIVETLNPSSIIAQAYMATASLSEDEKQRFVREYNQHALENDIYTKKGRTSFQFKPKKA
jgi:surface protein